MNPEGPHQETPPGGPAFTAACDVRYERPEADIEAERLAAATALELDPNTPWPGIYAEADRRAMEALAEHNKSLGVSATASFWETAAAERKQLLVRRAREVGLPDGATEPEVAAAEALREQLKLQKEIKELKLPAHVGW